MEGWGIYTKQRNSILLDSNVIMVSSKNNEVIDIGGIIKKTGKKPLVLRKQGGYSFRLKD